MAAEFIGMCRTIVYQQQSFRRTDVLQMLMAFNCWYEFFRKPLGKNFRIHPRTSLRVIDHRECIHSYVFEDLGFADFPMRTGFSLWVPVAFVQPSTVKRSLALLNPGADFSWHETKVLVVNISTTAQFRLRCRFVPVSVLFPPSLFAVFLKRVQQFLLLLKVSRLECWGSLCHAAFWICVTNQLKL